MPSTPSSAYADVIQVFDLSGSASCCTVSGTLTVDETSGTATALDVTLSGVDPFTVISIQIYNSSFNDYFVHSVNDQHVILNAAAFEKCILAPLRDRLCGTLAF